MGIVGIRKVLAEGPGVLASGLLWLIMAALLPAPISGAAVLALMVGAGVLAAGWGEAWLIRRLWRGRPISRIQWRILVGSVEHIDPRTQVWVVPGSGVCAYPVGRRSVMVSSGLLDELVAGILPHQVATALIVGAQAQLQAGMARRDPAIRLWCLPASVISALTRPLRRNGLVRLGWTLRPVVFGGAIVQMYAAGWWGIAVALAALLGLTYFAPRWRRAWGAQQVRVFDAAVVAAGRGADLAWWMRRVEGPHARDRIVALENPRLPQPI